MFTFAHGPNIYTLSRAMCLNVHDHKFENFVCLYPSPVWKKMYDYNNSLIGHL